MKKKCFLWLILHAVWFLTASCNPMPPNCETNPEDCTDTIEKPPYTLLWSDITHPKDTSYTLIEILLRHKNMVIYVKFLDNIPKPVVARDFNTGKILWEWGDPKIKSGYDIDGMKVVNDKLVISSWSDLYVLDVETGQKEWDFDAKSTGDCGSPGLNIINDRIYVTIEECSSDRQWTSIVSTPYQYLSLKTLFTQSQDDVPGWVPSFSPPSLWVHPSGDSIMIFQNRYFKLGIAKERADLIAFNTKSQSVLWRIDSCVENGASTGHNIQVFGDKVYYAAWNYIYCIDALTGKKIWTFALTEKPLNFAFSIITMSNGVLYVQPGGSGRLIALNPETGSIIWDTPKISSHNAHTTGQLQIDGNRLYFQAPWTLCYVDLTTGQKTHEFESPNKLSNRIVTFPGPAVCLLNEDKSILFTYDNYHVMALKVK